MALPTTRRQLKDWVLTKLGAPVIDINISPEQCEDRLSEALDYFKQYHFDGVQDIYLQHKITGSKLNFASAVTTEFQTNEKIIGLTSGAETKFFDKAGDNLSIRVYDTKKDNQYANFIQFLPGETIKGESTNTVAVLAATNPFVAGDIDRHYLPLGDDIIAISHLLKLDTGYPGAGMWNVKNRGIKYTGLTVGGGTANDIGFKWSNPNIIGVVDNAAAVVMANTSDYRLKEQFTTLDTAESLLKIRQLRPGHYFPKDFDGTVAWDRPQIGMIAHEVAEVVPMVVLGEKDALSPEGTNIYQSVNYAGLVPHLIAAIKEQQKQIDELKAKLDQLG